MPPKKKTEPAKVEPTPTPAKNDEPEPRTRTRGRQPNQSADKPSQPTKKVKKD